MARITLPRQIGLQVASARRALGLTQAQLAQRAGVSRQLVNRLEVCTATGIALDKLLAMLDACGCVLAVSSPSDVSGDFGERPQVVHVVDLGDEYAIDETLFDDPSGGV